MQTPHNSPIRDRLLHRVEYEEIGYWKDQVAWMGLMLWNMRHRDECVQPGSKQVPPATPLAPPVVPTSVVGSFPDIPYTTTTPVNPPLPPFQRTVRYAYPERQYVN